MLRKGCARHPTGAAMVGLCLLLAGGGSAVLADPPPAAAAHEFYFTRGIYGSGDWGPRWAVDYPTADRQFLIALRRLTVVDAFPTEHAVAIDDPRLRDFPFAYIVEVGSLSLDPAQVAGVREYLQLTADVLKRLAHTE